MLSVGNAVYLLLKADSTLAALVTNTTGIIGIWAGPMPQNGSFPVITRYITNIEEIQIFEPPGISALVKYEFRFNIGAKSVTKEKAQELAFNVLTAMKNALRSFGKGYIYDLSSPVDKLWIEGISDSRNFNEEFNEVTNVWMTGVTYDIAVKPTH
jgi:hypothetical protein